MVKRYPKVRSRNGKHYYRYDVMDPRTGKRKQKETKGYASPKEAYQAGLIIEEELRKGIYVDEKKILVSEWADQWLSLYAESGRVKNSTIRIRTSEVKRLKNEIGMMKLKDVSPLHCQKILNKMKGDGKAKNTISSFNVTISMMFRKAVQAGILQVNPAQKIEMPSFQQTVEELENDIELPKFLEKEELSIFLKECKNTDRAQFYHMMFTLAYTGMRIGELLALKPADIDFSNKQIRITKTLYYSEGTLNFTLNTPKTNSSKRTIDVSENVIKIINKQLAWRNEFKMSRRDEYFTGHDFLFVNAFKYPGYPCTLKSVQKFMKGILRNLSLNEKLSPHSLRHTYTSLMAEAGVELTAIQKLLGHQSDRITELIYLHVTKAKKKEAVEKLDELMSSLL